MTSKTTKKVPAAKRKSPAQKAREARARSSISIRPHRSRSCSAGRSPIVTLWPPGIRALPGAPSTTIWVARGWGRAGWLCGDTGPAVRGPTNLLMWAEEPTCKLVNL